MTDIKKLLMDIISSEPSSYYDEVGDLKPLDQLTAKQLSVLEVGTGNIRKMYSKIKAIELLLKMDGLDTTVNKPIDLNINFVSKPKEKDDK